eukprot:m.232312 g.232312  ORF g.232312 m.232312 type:complete len:134 (+) comp17075_c4_seq1:711-1112(+)
MHFGMADTKNIKNSSNELNTCVVFLALTKLLNQNKPEQQQHRASAFPRNHFVVILISQYSFLVSARPLFFHVSCLPLFFFFLFFSYSSDLAPNHTALSSLLRMLCALSPVLNKKFYYYSYLYILRDCLLRWIL